MPNRIIKESICTSENIDQLTPFQETAFIRLMVNCDDFGRFDGRLKVLSSRLFPLKDVTTEQMQETLDALIAANLVTVEQGYGKPVVIMKTWGKHQRSRATETKYPLPSDNQPSATCGQLSASCGQLSADDSKAQETADNCARIRNRIRNNNSLFDNRNRNTEGLIDDDEAHEIQSEQNRVLDAAEDAGFQKTNSVRAGLLKLYADYGLDKMLTGIDSCVKHSASNLAYLEAVLKGTPRKRKAQVSAQDYEQRDYSNVQDELASELAQEIAQMKAGAV